MTHHTDAQLAEWLALEERASEEPWVEEWTEGLWALRAPGNGIPAEGEGCYIPEQEHANAAFIAAARTGWPATIRDLQETRARERVLREYADHKFECNYWRMAASCSCGWAQARALLGEEAKK